MYARIYTRAALEIRCDPRSYQCHSAGPSADRGKAGKAMNVSQSITKSVQLVFSSSRIPKLGFFSERDQFSNKLNYAHLIYWKKTREE